MRGHGLRVLERPAGFEIGRDPGRAEGMAADPDPRPEIGGAALDHSPGVDAVHRLFGQRADAAGGGAEQESLAFVADAGGLNVSIKIGFEIVMRGHLGRLPPFSCRRTHQRLPLG